MISIDHPAAQAFLRLLNDSRYRDVVERTLETPVPVWYHVAENAVKLYALTPQETKVLLTHWRMTHA